MEKLTKAGQERYFELEHHYRYCACRSDTPFFSDRNDTERDKSAHTIDTSGQIYRTKFQEDRDRILYSLSFRRLRLKSQMFPEYTSDHMRTRLDHSLEVAQIARHIARQLKLNEDLVDAIALGHDIGHAPFGHSGERALHAYLAGLDRDKEDDPQKYDGFKHNWQGLRVVDFLEKSYPEHNGLNLTNAVRIGILLHTRRKYKDRDKETCKCDMDGQLNFDSESKHIKVFEVQVGAFADDTAQVVHEFEDAVISRIFNLSEIVKERAKWPFIEYCLTEIEKRSKKNRLEEQWQDLTKLDLEDSRNLSLLMARLRSEIIYRLTNDAINYAKPKLDAWETAESISTYEKFNQYVNSKSGFEEYIKLDKFAQPVGDLRDIIKDKVVNSERVSRMDCKAAYLIRHIMEVYITKPKQVPQQVLDWFAEYSNPQLGKTGIELRRLKDAHLEVLVKINKKQFVRAAIDYIAGMTDRFLLREYDQLYSAYPRTEM